MCLHYVCDGDVCTFTCFCLCAVCWLVCMFVCCCLYVRVFAIPDLLSPLFCDCWKGKPLCVFWFCVVDDCLMVEFVLICCVFMLL